MSSILSIIGIAMCLGAQQPTLPAGTVEESTLEPLAGSRPLIKRTYRPPNYESPAAAFDRIFTPHDRFFVRSHHSNIPKIELKDWKLKISGDSIGHPIELDMKQLKREFKQVEVPALAYCSGNRRGLFEPHVPGVQWANGAMGNAVWKGVRVKDVLKRAGIEKNALEVVFDGQDSPVLEKAPDFRKSLPLAKALDEDTIIAFEMNGKPLPMSQGYPARVVVPGWTATYWVKQLISIEVVSKPYDGFWMKSAYRIPRGKFPDVETKWPGQEGPANTPITEIIVNSMITNVADGGKLRGLAWDGGHGIAKVEVSSDGGATWAEARLGKDYGKYSWREFTYRLVPKGAGKPVMMSRATNGLGHTQAATLVANPAGYHNNVIHGLPESAAPVVAVRGNESNVHLKDGPGKDKVATACITCHSLDYIQMNSPFLDRKGWEAEVQKMIKVMGAPIGEEDAAEIVAYLAKYYGKTGAAN